MFDNKPKSNQPTKVRPRNSAEINDDARGTYNTNSQIKFKASMVKSSLCNYGNGYILVSGTIAVTSLGVSGGNNGIEILFKNCAPFTDCIRKINSTQRSKAKNIDLVMTMYNLIEQSDNYSKRSGILWQ